LSNPVKEIKNEQVMHEIKEENSEVAIQREKLSLIYNKDDISVKTDLTQEQVNAVVGVEIFAKYYNIPLLFDYTQNFKEHQISKDRKGRIEATQILTASQMEEKEDSSVFDRLVKGRD
jgi:lipopolysaccharide export LptBFGC system permease protein LptF